MVAGPAQSGRSVPLATVAPPNDMASAIEDAVAANEQKAEVDFAYLLHGPAKDMVPLAQLNGQPKLLPNAAYCWSAVRESDSDYSKIKRAGTRVQPASELLRLNLVLNFAAEVNPDGVCKSPVVEMRGICLVSKHWMIWYKLTRAASASPDFLIWDICSIQRMPVPGPMTMLAPPPQGRSVPMLPLPTAHQYVKFMESIKPH